MPSALTQPAEPAPGSFPVVGIGASAGGLEAFMQLLAALPAEPGMALVFVQHLDPRHDSRLVDLLGRSTPMPVVEATPGLALRSGHVYVIAPDTTLALADDGTFLVEPRGRAPGPHLPIDHLFRSLALRYASRAIGVVLSGTGSDGTMGLEEIKAAGGVSFAQDEASAKFSGMPLAATHSGCVDLVLPPERIAAELLRVGRHPYLAPAAAGAAEGGDAPRGRDEADHFRAVLALLRTAHGVDFAAYRDTTIRRRIMRRMMLHGGASLGAYVERLRGNRAELDALFHDILINVTRFFREPEVFEALKERVFPGVLAARQGDAPIRIWVPGCATGQEAYSLAMVLLEYLDDKPVHPPIQIFATDLSDSTSLQKARIGLYPESIEAEVSPQRLRRFFHKEDSHWRISKALREIVVFARQNVAADPPFSRMDLISCRNLLIYLSPALQKRVIPTFHYALNGGGFLVLGASETIGAHTDLFSVVDQQHRIYARKSSAARPYPHFRADEHQARLAGRPEPSGPQRPTPSDWHREADRVAAGQYMPPGVLINDDFDILQFRGQTGPYLAPAAGEPSHSLLKMAREGLFMAVRDAVGQCRQSGTATRLADLRLRGEGGERRIDLHVLPVKLPQSGDRCYLVLFEDTAQRAAAGAAPSSEPPPSADPAEVQQLRHELSSTREYLQSLLEQQDAANEELKSANEEILSSNEELQSTNEELETAKEELQSINEELTTVNEQLQLRNTELASLNDDMSNLLASGGIPQVVLGVDLRILRFTPAAARLLGLLAGDVGRPLGHLKLGVELPDLQALVESVVTQVQPQQRDVSGPDGRAYQLRLHPYRTSDNRIAGVVLVLLDVHEHLQLQQRLEDQRDYARAIVETVREPLLVLDHELRVQTANPAFYRSFEVAPDETTGRLLYELGNDQWDIPSLREQLAGVLSRSVDVVDFDVQHHFQAIGAKLMRLNARRIVRKGECTELILLAIEDRTELARLEELYVQRLEGLVQEDRRKTVFLALLAHELRNPLAPIRNALHVLERAETDAATAQRMHATIGRQVRQLTRLVDDLLDVARINQGRIDIRKERIDLLLVLRDALDTAQPGCDAKRITLAATLPQEPLLVDGDAARLVQALGNLLGNACKFTAAGGRITLTLQREGGEAVVRVRDIGIGIAAEHLKRIFEVFVQADSAIDSAHDGLGLGLALARQLTEAHGGTVSAASDGIGHGSEFVLRLPLAPAPDAAPGAAEAEAAADGTAAASAAPVPAAPRRILVVDDSLDGAESLSLVLSLEGHSVRTADDGPTALALAEHWLPEVVLLDIGLPGMSGYEVARRMAQQPWRRGARLIALTGWGQPEDRRRSAEAGFDAHLVKPVDLQTLLQLLAAPAPK